MNNQTNKGDGGEKGLGRYGESSQLGIITFQSKKDSLEESGHATIVRIFEKDSRHTIDHESDTYAEHHAHHVLLTVAHGFVGSRPTVIFRKLFLAVRNELEGLKGVSDGEDGEYDVFQDSHVRIKDVVMGKEGSSVSGCLQLRSSAIFWDSQLHREYQTHSSFLGVRAGSGSQIQVSTLPIR